MNMQTEKKNPFTPNFGQVPLEIAGRNDVINSLEYAFSNAPGDPALTSILVGARGNGKTALMSYIGKQMRTNGWIVVHTSCIPGMLEDIYIQTIRETKELLSTEKSYKVSATLKASFAILSGEIRIQPESISNASNWRLRITEIIEELNKLGIGLIITIDELDPKLDEMTTFASVYQMLIREERKVALIMAGLPNKVSGFLNNEKITFMRRATKFTLTAIPKYDVRNAFKATVERGGKTIAEEALDIAVDAINGFPFMLQLVGYRSFIAAGTRKRITKEDVRAGIAIAKNDLKDRVLKSTLDEISDTGIVFLQAMANDTEPSTISSVAKAMNQMESYVRTYHNRLLERGVIMDTSVVRGNKKFVFALPYMKEYLEEYER